MAVVADAAIERVTKRGWHATDSDPPGLNVICGALVPRVERDFEVAVHDTRGADTGVRAKFTVREAPRLVRTGRSAALHGTFGAETKAQRLRFSVRADAIDAVPARRVSWVAPVKNAHCDLAAAAPIRGKVVVRKIAADGHTGDTIAYLDPKSIEVTRVGR